MIPLHDDIPSRRPAVVNYLLILVSTLIFLYEIGLGSKAQTRLFFHWGLVPAHYAGVSLWALMLAGKWARLLPLVTYIFLHGSWLHLIGNMLYLWVFGDNVEDRLGHFRYLILYLGAGVAGGLMQVWSNPGATGPTIGASGAIAGVLGAYLISFPRARVISLIPVGIFPLFIPIPAVIFLILWFGLQLLNGMFSLQNVPVGGDVVAWWAHVGGFAAGIILLALLRPRRQEDYY